MSAGSLQRVVVRMLYDPAFAAAVYADPEGALRDESLAPEERRWLTVPDPRAYRTDPVRRARSLKALLEEFPASAALSGRPAALDAFFSSPAFHRCLREGESLSLSFGAWMEERSDPGVARLETALAATRRAPSRPPPPPPDHLTLVSGVSLVEVPAGTLERRQEILARLGPDPLALLASGSLPALPPPGDGPPVTLLVVRLAGGELRAEELPEGIASLLRAATIRPTRAELLLEARRLGLDAVEAEEIVSGLFADGLLCGA